MLRKMVPEVKLDVGQAGSRALSFLPRLDQVQYLIDGINFLPLEKVQGFPSSEELHFFTLTFGLVNGPTIVIWGITKLSTELCKLLKLGTGGVGPGWCQGLGIQVASSFVSSEWC